nr:hypothetical protein [uncultured Carboxylicivirga sp.]
MKYRLKIAIAVITLLSSCNSNNQNKDIELSEFYRVYFEQRGDKMRLYTEADSLNANLQLKDFGNSMWAYNDYLFRNNSKTIKLYSHFKSLLPDTSAIKQEFKTSLKKDIEFKELFKQSLINKNIPSITIDSLSVIASRFYLVHRIRNQVYIHLCANINEVQSLEQNKFSPYYNAFCFMTIRMNDEASDLASTLLTPYSAELDNQENISDERFLEIKNEVFETASKNKQLQDVLIKEYNKKKEFLNFELVMSDNE